MITVARVDDTTRNGINAAMIGTPVDPTVKAKEKLQTPPQNAISLAINRMITSCEATVV